MPETIEQALRDVVWSSDTRSELLARTRTSTETQRAYMRHARALGASLGKIAQASGLSIAQVQRICDLSKDKGGNDGA